MAFIIVNYEENDSLIVTKDCSAANIMNYLTKQLPWNQPDNPTGAELDLCDSSGRLIGLRYMGNSNAGSILAERNIYYPVILKDDRPVNLLLSTNNKNYKQLMAQVIKFCSTSKGLHEDSGTSSKKSSSQSQDKRKKGKSPPKGKQRK